MAGAFQQAKTDALREKQDAKDLLLQASELLKQVDTVEVCGTPIIELITLHSEVLGELTKGTKRKIGSDGHLVRGLVTTLAGLKDLRAASLAHPQLLKGSSVSASPAVAIASNQAMALSLLPSEPIVTSPLRMSDPPCSLRQFIDIASLNTAGSTPEKVESQGVMTYVTGIFAPSVVLLCMLRKPAYRTLQAIPLLLIVWLVASGLSCMIFLVIYPETWVELWLAPLDALPSYIEYAASRIGSRLKTRLFSVFSHAT